MANIQVDITANGTTTLATAGKWCDKNIDINVEVPLQGTQFTNLYDAGTITIDTAVYASSADGMYTQSDTESNYIIVPAYHATGDPFVLRLRGIVIPRGRVSMCVLNSSKERITHFSVTNTSYFTHGIDEHGDAMITLNSGALNREWYYICFNFQYVGMSSASSVLSGPIITINEPIGNGGRVV